ncbi:dual specificity protein phosphatase family protein [Leptolyngbya sp. FACHB-261]|uniref:protein-tyrosine phosphatase family protein n=1 Tax=Leptolyngbya sp. FACHB-261 TaxID=2692806 RepID=UPI00168229BF|nr:dual specificity protein phosphatase family protein [Leptolyngbya sp. FACHB-261]MBD2104061.1 dual specificity protein phosphatase family protein [Leptolyngbya sp. FACHB-261]
MYKFAAASETETVVFGAARPRHAEKEVSRWIKFMHEQGMQRVCCLLPQSQLAPYPNLLSRYQQEFGADKVLWAPIEDFHLVDQATLTQRILPFLLEADQQNEQVVVHCSGGIGRTGYILAAWLVGGRGLTNTAAISAVRKTGRNPYEAAIAGILMARNPWKAVRVLNSLLDACR